MELPGMSLKRRADSLVDDIQGQLGGIVLFVGCIWLIFLSDYVPYVEWYRWLALRPRQLIGLHGIVTMPFVHGSFAHILSNTIPLIIMLLTLAALRPQTWRWVVAALILMSGLLTWTFGENNPIVGASALVLGLVTFLTAPGLGLLTWWGLNRVRHRPRPYPFRVRLVPLLVSGVVGFFCLDNLFFNLVPVFAPIGGASVSWRAHWCGAIAGCIVAFVFARSGQIDSLPKEVEDVMQSLAAESQNASHSRTT